MIHSAIVIRTADGMTLCSSTDERNKDLSEGSKKYLKLLAKQLNRLEHQCYFKFGRSNVYFIKNMDMMTYVVISDSKYPLTLAVCFLKEMQNEFSGKYDARSVAKMKRPYSCVEFNEEILQMIKRFNRPHSLTTRIDLQDVNTDLQIHPLKLIPLADLERPINANSKNGRMPNRAPQGVGPLPGLEPLQWFHYLLLGICVVLSLLSWYRCYEYSSSQTNVDESSFFPLIFGLHSLTSSVQGMFMIRTSFRSYKYLFHINFIACLYSLCLVGYYGYSDDMITVISIMLSITLHYYSMKRAHISKRPESMV